MYDCNDAYYLYIMIKAYLLHTDMLLNVDIIDSLYIKQSIHMVLVSSFP